MGRIGADIILRLFWNWARRADAESFDAEFTVVESSGDLEEDKFNAEFEAVVDDDDDDEAKSLIDDFTNLNFRPWSMKNMWHTIYVKKIECYCVSMEMLIIWEHKSIFTLKFFGNQGILIYHNIALTSLRGNQNWGHVNKFYIGGWFSMLYR